MVVALPTLAEVVQDRSRLAGQPLPVLASLLLAVGTLQSEIAAQVAQAGPALEAPIVPDRALTMAECAARLQVTVGTARLWFQTAPWSATVLTRSKTRVLVSEARFDALLRDGLHAPPHRPALGAGRRAGPRLGRPHTVGQGGGAR